MEDSNQSEQNIELSNNQMDSQSLDAGGWEAFTGAWTWENIGLQIGNGLISGAASWGLGMLLDKLFKDDEQLEDLLKNFADDIVIRVTENVRKIIYENSWKENMRELQSESQALSRKYRAYFFSTDDVLLNNSLIHSFDALENARSLGPNALGTFIVIAGVKMLTLREKANSLPGYSNVIIEELESSIGHINKMSSAIENSILTSIGTPVLKVYREPGERDFTVWHVPSDGKTTVIPREDAPTQEQAKSIALKRAYTPIENNIITPAMKVKNSWTLILADLKKNINP